MEVNLFETLTVIEMVNVSLLTQLGVRLVKKVIF